MFKGRNYPAFAIVYKSELPNAKITSQLLPQQFQKQQLFFIMEQNFHNHTTKKMSSLSSRPKLNTFHLEN